MSGHVNLAKRSEQLLFAVKDGVCGDLNCSKSLEWLMAEGSGLKRTFIPLPSKALGTQRKRRMQRLLGPEDLEKGGSAIFGAHSNYRHDLTAADCPHWA